MTSLQTADVPTRAALSRARLQLFGLLCMLSVVGLTLLGLLAINAEELGQRLDGVGAAAGPVLVIVGAVLIVAMVPSSVVAGGAGYAIGTAAGTGVALAAATLGAALCALIGRRVGTLAARHAFGQRVAQSAHWVDARPLRSVITARLLPGLPFNATSYVLGLTAIRVRDIALGTAIGFAPRCFAYAALGGSLHRLGSPEAKAALVASAALLVVMIVGPRLVRARSSRQ
jgi:uncharacterized membrane protein YdjX (TVP38/TMEM64 family)